ncbi:MAG: lysophospholipid acyltransferase family protein [Gammaproteobacteria bacterium]
MNRLLLILRSFIFMVCFYIFSIFFFTIALLTFPLPFHKRYVFISLWCHGVMWLLKKICRLNYVVQGLNHLPKTPAIIFSNHQSTWETIAFLLIFPPQSWVLKHELLKIPLFGWCAALLEPIAINRKKRKSAMSQVIELGKKRLEAGRWVVIFPEGTRVNPRENVPYKKGGAVLAAKSGYPVVPVAHNAGHFWPRKGFLKYPGTITLIIGTPIETNHQSANTINTMAQKWIEETKTNL